MTPLVAPKAFFDRSIASVSIRIYRRHGILTRQKHTRALVRDLPNSFVNALSQHHHAACSSSSQPPLDLSLARNQHEAYVQAMKQNLEVLQLPADDAFPDSLFVEDTVVVVGNRALLTHPGHPSRVGEKAAVRQALLEMDQLEVVDMHDRDLEACCDGGDVLYIPDRQHLFVGVSERTNEEAVQVLEDVFWDCTVIPVAAVAQGKHVLHLKSAVTHLDAETLLAPAAPMGMKVLRAMRAWALGYQALRLPDVLACNCVVLEGHEKVLVQDTKCIESREILEKAADERDLELVWVDTSELAKKDAALTCCSVLLSL